MKSSTRRSRRDGSAAAGPPPRSVEAPGPPPEPAPRPEPPDDPGTPFGTTGTAPTNPGAAPVRVEATGATIVTPQSHRRDARAISLVILAVLAVAYALYFAYAILFPVTLAVLLALLFRPVVRKLKRLGVPEAIGAAGVLATVLGALGIAGYFLSGPAGDFVTSVPAQLAQAKDKVKTLTAPFRRIDHAIKTGADLATPEPAGVVPDGAADGAVPGPQKADDRRVEMTEGPDGERADVDLDRDGTPERIVLVTSQPPLTTSVLLSTSGTVLAEIALCVVLLYFLLAGGDGVLNNVLRTMPTFREKRDFVEVIHSAESGMSRYLVTITLINAGLGVCQGIALALIGVPNAPLWGVMGCLFNFIPYLGAMAGTVVVFLVSFLAFDSVGYALLAPAAYWGLTAIEGNFVTPTILGKRIRLNPIVIFLSLAFWGWAWGIGGALIAVPLLAMAKIVCDQYAPLKPIATLME